MHKRSQAKDVSPGMWDFCGGHVRYDEDVVDHKTLEKHIDQEARREGAEELFGGRGLEETPGQWSRVSGIGELLLDSTLNLEFATVFVVTIPSSRDIAIEDDVIGDRIERADDIVIAPYNELRAAFVAGLLTCAEGATSIFQRYQELTSNADGGL